MKRINFKMIAILIALSLSSCQKDPPPVQEPAGEYAGAEEAIAAVDALYRTGAPAFYGECSLYSVPVAAIGGYLSGFFETEAGIESKLYDNCRLLSFDGMADYTGEVWKRAYDAIGKCNEVIENISLTPGLSSGQRSHFEAEARFFRAFNYFYLVRAFGDVGKSKISQVYELIISDLNRAIAILPNEGFIGNNFRIGRPAAQTLLADVYLTMSGYPLRQNYYKQAAETARQVIEGEKHALIRNGMTPETSAYNLLRTQNDNRECIYSYKPQEGDAGRSLSALSLSKEAGEWGVVKIHTANAYRPTQPLFDIYESGEDIRIEEQQLFHSFVKYEKNERTVIQTFSRLPYFWFDRETLFGNGASQKSIIIYRHAEVLLIAAEAIAMSEGVTSKAVGYLADVRSRAYPKIDRETIVNQLTGLSTGKFIQQVWTERLREFPLEMKIWTDIQRTRKYPVAAPFNDDIVAFQDVIGATNPSNVTFEERHLLLPYFDNNNY